jgi:hypothetical protein
MNCFYRGKLLAALAMLATCCAAKVSMAGTLLYDPVVTVVGNGATGPGGSSFPTSVYLYSNSVAAQAAPVSSASYPSSSSGTRLTNSANATSEGSLSNNPKLADDAALGIAYGGTGYVYNAGYDAASGSTNVNSSATNANRSLGQTTVSANSVSNAVVLQTQTQAAAYSNNNIRGAVGDDTGTNLYAAGTGGGTTGGWRDFRSNLLISSTLTNVRTVEMLGGKLFGSTGSGNVGIYLIDPTGVTPASAMIITGSSNNHSPYEFALFNDTTNQNSVNGYNVAYIADDGGQGSAVGGIEKWTYNGSTWTQAYILKDAANAYRGLAGEVDPTTGNVTLFASTADGTKLQQVTDTGVGSVFTTLATAPTNDFFRGVALAPVPEPSTWALLLAAAGMVLVRGVRRLHG